MTETATMSGASLKVKLGALGLPPSWFGERLGVTMRTVVRWFDSDVVDARVAIAAEKLADQTLGEMRKLVSEVDDSDDPVILRTYRTDEEFTGTWPATWHRQLTFRLVEHFEAEGRTVVVEYR